MKNLKILKFDEFIVINESHASEVQFRQSVNDILKIRKSDPLYQSDNLPTDKKDDAVIALPAGEGSIESISKTVNKYFNEQKALMSPGFTIGKYCSGNYLSSGIHWDENSLCVSLHGALSDTNNIQAIAVELLLDLRLERVLMFDEKTIIEVVRGNGHIKHPHHRVKRINEDCN